MKKLFILIPLLLCFALATNAQSKVDKKNKQASEKVTPAKKDKKATGKVTKTKKASGKITPPKPVAKNPTGGPASFRSTDTYYIVNDNGFALDVAGGKGNNGDNLILWDRHNGDCQQYNLIPAGGNTYYILAKNRFAVDIQNGNQNVGNNVRIWHPNGSTAQKWKFIPMGGGEYYIETTQGLQLAPTNHSNKGANVGLKNRSYYEPTQRWRVIKK